MKAPSHRLAWKSPCKKANKIYLENYQKIYHSKEKIQKHTHETSTGRRNQRVS